MFSVPAEAAERITLTPSSLRPFSCDNLTGTADNLAGSSLKLACRVCVAVT